MIIIGFVSEIGGGKGALTKYLKDKYNAQTFRFSTILRDILKRVYAPDSRKNMQSLSTKIREALGQNILSKTMIQDIAQSQSEVVVIEGIRREGDIEDFRNNHDFYLIAIEADVKTRFERIIQRGENPDDTSKTWEEFQKQNQAEAEVHIKGLMEKAKFKINNNGTMEESEKQLDNIIKGLLISGN